MAVSPTPNPESSPPPPPPSISAIRGKIPNRFINHLNLKITGIFPAPEAPALEKQPLAEEYKPYELYLGENFNSYQYSFIDDDKALL